VKACYGVVSRRLITSELVVIPRLDGEMKKKDLFLDLVVANARRKGRNKMCGQIETLNESSGILNIYLHLCVHFRQMMSFNGLPRHRTVGSRKHRRALSRPTAGRRRRFLDSSTHHALLHFCHFTVKDRQIPSLLFASFHNAFLNFHFPSLIDICNQECGFSTMVPCLAIGLGQAKCPRIGRQGQFGGQECSRSSGSERPSCQGKYKIISTHTQDDE